MTMREPRAPCCPGECSLFTPFAYGRNARRWLADFHSSTVGGQIQ